MVWVICFTKISGRLPRFLASDPPAGQCLKRHVTRGSRLWKVLKNCTATEAFQDWCGVPEKKLVSTDWFRGKPTGKPSIVTLNMWLPCILSYFSLKPIHWLWIFIFHMDMMWWFLSMESTMGLREVASLMILAPGDCRIDPSLVIDPQIFGLPILTVSPIRG